MQRYTTADERESQLSEWEQQLSDREAELDAAIKQFRNHMEVEAMKIVKMQQDIANRETALAQQAKEVAEREQKLLENMRRYREALEAGEVIGDAPANQGVSPAAAKGGVSLDALAAAIANKHSDPNATTSSNNKESPYSTKSAASASRGSASDCGSPESRSSKKEKYTEGKVDIDPQVASYVEELSDSGSASEEEHVPRGLQGSPQFHKMDPNDSGMAWVRRRGSVVTLRQEDSMLQDDFDEAVEFLVGNNVMTEAEVIGMIEQGVDPNELIAAMLREQQSRTFDNSANENGVVGGDEDNDDDDDDDGVVHYQEESPEDDDEQQDESYEFEEQGQATTAAQVVDQSEEMEDPRERLGGSSAPRYGYGDDYSDYDEDSSEASYIESSGSEYDDSGLPGMDSVNGGNDKDSSHQPAAGGQPANTNATQAMNRYSAFDESSDDDDF